MAQYFYTKNKRLYVVDAEEDLTDYITFGASELEALLSSNFKSAKKFIRLF